LRTTGRRITVSLAKSSRQDSGKNSAGTFLNKKFLCKGVATPFHPFAGKSVPAALIVYEGYLHHDNEALRREFSKSYPRVNKVSPEAAWVRISITGVTAEVETATFYDEVTSFVTLAGGWLGAGKRDRMAFLLIEAELTDSVTGEKLGMALRKVPAKKLLTDDRQQLTLDVVRPFLDERAANARVVLERVMK
jgi:hypothetical protein